MVPGQSRAGIEHDNKVGRLVGWISAKGRSFPGDFSTVAQPKGNDTSSVPSATSIQREGIPTYYSDGHIELTKL